MTYRRPLPASPPTFNSAASYQGWAGKSFGWRYYAQRTDGTGAAGIFLHNELKLQEVSIDRVLSGPGELKALISPVDLTVRSATGAAEPLIMPEKGTLIHAEFNGDITDSFLLMGTGMSGPDLSIDGAGLSVVAKNLSYPTSVTFTEVDPLDVIRHIWQVIQATTGSNMALVVDPDTRTDQRVGKSAIVPVDTSSSSTSTTSTTGSADEKPFELNWWSTHDLGGEIDKLCEENGIEYRVKSMWNSDKTQVLHYLEFGYPALGIRRTELRFVVGENIQVMPDLSRDGGSGEYANHVAVLGAGEGSEMIRGEARRLDGRVRTMVTVDDKSITDKGRAQRVAALELNRRQQLTQISDIVIRNTGLAPLGSFGPGDEIRVSGMTDWAPFDIWARVIGVTVNPDTMDLMQARIMRSDWV